MHYRPKYTAFTAALVMLWNPASAQIAFDNYGPGIGFNFAQSDIFAGPGALGSDLDVGIGFDAQASGRIGTIELALGLFAGSNSLSIEIYDSNGALPGTLLYNSGPLEGLLRPIGQNFSSVAIDIDEAVNLLLGERYFIIASANGDTEAIWHRISIGDLGPAVGQTNNTGFGVSTRARNTARVTLVPAPSGLTACLFLALTGTCRRRATR